MIETYDACMILGPTASGKTRLAVEICSKIKGEVLNADSRMVYKHLNIGTGKDLHLYSKGGEIIPSHLIDLAEPGEAFHIYAWQKAFYSRYHEIKTRQAMPVICGGSGLYLESVLKGFNETALPVNQQIREQLTDLTREELLKIWTSLPEHPYKSQAATDSRLRLIRAIEKLTSLLNTPAYPQDFFPVKAYIIGLNPPVTLRQKLIRERLELRLQEGLIEEAESLLKMGISHERLQFLGLEYRFLSLYLQGIYTLDEMTELLYIAIRQFAKRQMTYFRKLERDGFHIHWFQSADEAIHYFNTNSLPILI